MIPAVRVAPAIVGHLRRRHQQLPSLQQVRWKRKDGHRYHLQNERPPTQKQRKQHNRRKNLGKSHGVPGSKAGPRRESQRRERQDILNPPPPSASTMIDNDTYTADDALLDDLMGHARRSQPHPVPAFYGHQQRKYMNRVVDRMEQLQRGSVSSADDDCLDVSLPPDKSIALALKAFRDQSPKKCGLVHALRHVVHDLGVPMRAWGEHTYTTLLTCCASPAEGRRVLALQISSAQPISSYSWSILVDLYAQQADWRGCVAVHTEMLQDGGVAPTLASYTSLLAACAKTCRNGRIAHAERAEAGKVAFEQWQELHIVGLEPDVMTYGAMLAVYAARGQPEKSLGLLEEMARHEVLPTSYIYQQCLLAVARSHALSLRYDSADTPRFRRREQTALHHGKMARQVLIQAEAASADLDDGLVSALIQCAAVAGDMATAKAVYTAAQIRKEFTEWRLIGSDAHLAQLRGEEDPQAFDSLSMDSHSDGDSSGSSEHQLTSVADTSEELTSTGQQVQQYTESSPQTRHAAFTRRKYGKDSRVLSAVLLSCSKALDHRHLGSMWQGRENEGFYCINSLRLMAEPRKPEYTNDSIPGQTITDNLTWEGEHRDIEDPRKKFGGVHVDESVPSSLDELDDSFSKFFVNDEGELLEEFRKSTPADIWDLKYSEKGTTAVNSHIAAGSSSSEQQHLLSSSRRETPKQQEPTMYFDSDTMSWKQQSVTDDARGSSTNSQASIAVAHTISKSSENSSTKKTVSTATPASNLFFDYDTMKWQTRETPSTPSVFPGDVSDLSSGPSSDSSELISDDSDDDEADFFGKDPSPNDSEDELDALEENILQYATGGSNEDENDDDITTMHFGVNEASKEDPSSGESSMTKPKAPFDATEFHSFYTDLKQAALSNGEDDVDEDEAREIYVLMKQHGEDDEQHQEFDDGDSDEEPESAATPFDTDEANGTRFDAFDKQDEAANALAVEDDRGYDVVLDQEEELDHELDALRDMLPAFPESRLRTVRDVFHKSLDNPPLLELIPVVRETMPDYISGSWLQKMSFLTAKFVAHQAATEEKIDIHMLNGVLGLYTAAGSLDNALEFHQTEFEQYGFTPTEYSDRLVLQMFLKNNRFARALAFKQSVENGNRTLDIKAYGSLIEYCSRRKQLGSGMLLARECVSLHGKMPEEASLKRLRLLSRQAGLESQLDDIVGEDPFSKCFEYEEGARLTLFRLSSEWARYGEAKLKRESSKWGKRDVQHGANQLLRI